jgi:hypothetical protein
MPLTKILKEWAVSENWKDDIEVNDDRSYSRIVTTYSIYNQPHRTLLEVAEKFERFSVFMYSPVSVPPARMADMTRILNRINTRLGLGRFACHDDEDSNPVQFLVRIDVEGGALAPQQITTMVKEAYWAFRPYGQLIATAALTKQSANDLWAKFLAEEAAEEAAQKRKESRVRLNDDSIDGPLH